MRIFRLFLSLFCILGISFSLVHAKPGMVEISIEITEINTSKANELGIKWGDSFKAGQVGFSVDGRVPAVMPQSVLPNVPSLIKVSDWAQYTALTAELKILQEKGVAQILSNPKILTKSGTSARVIVGGEFPVIAVGNVGGSVDWKEYGIKAEITPVILANEMIDLELLTEVSRLDYSRLSGGYPSIVKREAKTFVKIKSGQTITIAGLLETRKEKFSSGIPLLCDIPLIGYLFSRKSSQEVKTNVLIFVTPKIIVQ